MPKRVNTDKVVNCWWYIGLTIIGAALSFNFGKKAVENGKEIFQKEIEGE